MKQALIFAICAVCLMLPAGISARDGGQLKISGKDGRKPVSGDSLYSMNSMWTDQDGRSISLTRFRGKPLVLAMIYTRCKDICPMIVSDMQKIENAIPEPSREHVGFALFSFDPAQDGPSQLKQYASAHGLDLKHRTLLTGSDDSVRLLAAVLDIRYKKELTGDFTHSRVITVLDSEGEFQRQQVGIRKDIGEIVSVLNDLLVHGK